MPTLRKTVDQDTLTFEQFELQVEPGDYQSFASDPEAFLRDVISQSGGEPPRAVAISERLRSISSFGDLPPIQVVHIIGPPSQRCLYIVVDPTPEM